MQRDGKKGKHVRSVDKPIGELEVGDVSWPRHSGRYRGVSVGRDKKGYYVCTHRARSKSYELVRKIPLSDIRRIRSTGSRIPLIRG